MGFDVWHLTQYSRMGASAMLWTSWIRLTKHLSRKQRNGSSGIPQKTEISYILSTIFWLLTKDRSACSAQRPLIGVDVISSISNDCFSMKINYIWSIYSLKLTMNLKLMLNRFDIELIEWFKAEKTLTIFRSFCCFCGFAKLNLVNWSLKCIRECVQLMAMRLKCIVWSGRAYIFTSNWIYLMRSVRVDVGVKTSTKIENLKIISFLLCSFHEFSFLVECVSHL